MAKPKADAKRLTPAQKAGQTRRKYDRAKLVPIICARLATGEPLRVICRDLGIPRETITTWRQQDEAIAAQFDEARDDGYDAIADDCLAIADDSRRDYVQGKDGEVVDHDHIQRSKLRVDTRLKLLAKWDPRRYGEKLQHSNDPENPLPAPQFIIQPVRPASADE